MKLNELHNEVDYDFVKLITDANLLEALYGYNIWAHHNPQAVISEPEKDIYGISNERNRGVLRSFIRSALRSLENGPDHIVRILRDAMTNRNYGITIPYVRMTPELAQAIRIRVADQTRDIDNTIKYARRLLLSVKRQKVA